MKLKGFRKIKKIVDNKLIFSLALLFMFSFYMIALHKTILDVSYIHAEDGIIFFNNMLDYGFKSFGMTYGGYLCTISRVFIVFAFYAVKLTNDIYIIGNTIEICAMIFTSLVFIWFSSNEFEFLIKSRLRRIIISIIFITVIATYNDIIYNGVGIHWVCGFVIFLTSLQLINKKLPSYKSMLLILPSIISSASTMILGFAMIFYIFTSINWKDIKSTLKDLTKEQKVKIILLGS